MGYGSDVAMSCGVDHRHSSDPEWMVRRPVATAPIRPLGWEPPYAAGAALKKKTKKKGKMIPTITTSPKD